MAETGTNAVELDEDTGWNMHSWFILLQFTHLPPGALW